MPASKDPGNGEAVPVILVVDDEPMLLDVARCFLDLKKCRVLTAASGSDALDILARERGNVDVVVSDVNMLPMDGYELALEVRRRYPAIRLQMVSGFEGERSYDDPVRETLRRELIKKPFTLASLWERIQSLLGGGVTSSANVTRLDDRRRGSDRRRTERRKRDRRCEVVAVDFERRVRDNRVVNRRVAVRRTG